MRITKIIAVGMIVLIGAVATGGSFPAGKTGDRPFHLPSSLDAYYPPAADRPVYLLRMLSLEASFAGIIVDLMEDDMAGARGSYEDFQRQYREMAGMVPEWKGKYPEDSIKELGAALAAARKEPALRAYEAVGCTCHECHAAAMVPVQQKFHWGDFGAADVWDPTGGKAVPYRQFKEHLAANLAGISVDLNQRQTDNARRQFEAFRARFGALTESCRACHEQERRYYVDREMQDTVAELGKTLQQKTIALERATALLQKIGQETCSKCHLVHLPAAYPGRSMP